MSDEELDEFLGFVVSKVDSSIMDERRVEFSPTFFIRELGGDVICLTLTEYPHSAEQKTSLLKVFAEKTAEASPQACGIANMVMSQPSGSLYMPIATMSSDGKTRFALFELGNDEEGLLVIKEKIGVPSEKGTTLEFFGDALAMLSQYFKNLSSV